MPIKEANASPAPAHPGRTSPPPTVGRANGCFPMSGPLPIGSDSHRDAACRMFHDTFNPYKPSVIEWPKLDPEALQRLTSLPIWDIAVTTETKARARMLAYGESVDDPAWREAIQRNGWEEGRHKEVLSHLVSSYGIQLAPEPPDQLPPTRNGGIWSPATRSASTASSHSACSKVARRSGYFPPELWSTRSSR